MSAVPACGNPFVGTEHERSTYHGSRGGRLVLLTAGPPTPPNPAAVAAHARFTDMVLGDDGYTCVAARSALKREQYRFGWYPAMATPAATVNLARDLCDFIAEFPIRADRFATFIAAFDGPDLAGEKAFEETLWQQLQSLHELDARHHGWDAAVTADPLRRGFSFSFALRSFFLVGMHPQASRLSRRTATPTIVFNAHAQFEILRDTGRMERMQEVNRARDVRRQGSVNPNLDRFEVDSEAVMYSGRHVEPEWTCPLRITPGPRTSSVGKDHP